MDNDKTPQKIPATLQKEIRSKLAALGIKLTIAAEELQTETDEARARELREQIVALKAEAKTVIDKYRWAKSTYSEDPSALGAKAVTADALDGMLVFGDIGLDDPSAGLASVPADVGPVEQREMGDVSLVMDLVGLDPDEAPRIFADETPAESGVVLDEVEFSLTLIDEAGATVPRETPARGGRMGMALGIAAELAAGRESEWGGPLLAALLETAALALSSGADEEEAAAASLFAAIDIATEELSLQEIRAALGDRVVELVAWCAWMLRIDPWVQRDRAYMVRLQSAPAPAVFLSVCGRLVGARAMLARKAVAGTGALDRPGRERERLVWSLRALVKAYRSIADPALLGRLMDEWEEAVEAVGQRVAG